MLDRKVFSERLVSIREDRRIMAKDVAIAIGLTKATISLLESGKISPSVNTLIALGDFFDVSLDYLVGRSGLPDTKG